MRRAFLGVLLLLSALTLSACERAADIGAPEADQQNARSYIEMLRANQFDDILKNADPSLEQGAVRAQLDQMAAQFPAEEPKSVKLIVARVTNSTDPAGAQAQRVDMTYAYVFASAHVLSSVALKRTATATTIVSFNAARIPEDYNTFSLAGRSFAQYAALALALAVPLFTLWTVVLYIRTPLERTRKWLWCLFIVVSPLRANEDETTTNREFTLEGALALSHQPWLKLSRATSD